MEGNVDALSKNLQALRNNPYPGRGIIVGLDQTGEHVIQVYWIMGRSENSRNCVLDFDEGGDGVRVFAAAADPSKVRDPSLIIYNAMRRTGDYFVVSSGHQTDGVIESLAKGYLFEYALKTWQYEPNAPTFTPRITAVWSLGVNPHAAMSILRKAPDNDECVRWSRNYPLEQFSSGTGLCVTTYRGDGDPLPPFEGGPYLLPLVGDRHDVVERYLEVLKGEHLISLAVNFISISDLTSAVHILNKYKKVA